MRELSYKYLTAKCENAKCGVYVYMYFSLMIWWMIWIQTFTDITILIINNAPTTISPIPVTRFKVIIIIAIIVPNPHWIGLTFFIATVNHRIKTKRCWTPSTWQITLTRDSLIDWCAKISKNIKEFKNYCNTFYVKGKTIVELWTFWNFQLLESRQRLNFVICRYSLQRFRPRKKSSFFNIPKIF